VSVSLLWWLSFSVCPGGILLLLPLFPLSSHQYWEAEEAWAETGVNDRYLDAWHGLYFLILLSVCWRNYFTHVCDIRPMQQEAVTET